MRHRVLSKRLKRTSGELKSLMVNQSKQLFDRGSVTTTLSKAKLLRPFAEKLVTLAKDQSFTNVKRVKSVLADDGAVRTLFQNVAPKFLQRPGGYTRIIKLGNRGGDNAPLGRLEFVEDVKVKAQKLDKKEAKAGKSKDKVKKAVGKKSAEKVKKDAKN